MAIDIKELELRLAHVGINASAPEEAERTARLLCDLFGLEYRPGRSSIFAGPWVEVMRTPYLGRNGHIGFETCDVEKAVQYLAERGHKVDPSTAKYGEDGAMKSVYLAEEAGGFALHFVRKS